MARSEYSLGTWVERNVNLGSEGAEKGLLRTRIAQRVNCQLRRVICLARAQPAADTAWVDCSCSPAYMATATSRAEVGPGAWPRNSRQQQLQQPTHSLMFLNMTSDGRWTPSTRKSWKDGDCQTPFFLPACRDSPSFPSCLPPSSDPAQQDVQMAPTGTKKPLKCVALAFILSVRSRAMWLRLALRLLLLL